MKYRDALLAFKRSYFMALLWEHNGNMSAVARTAAVPRNSLYVLFKRYGVDIRKNVLNVMVEQGPDGLIVRGEPRKRKRNNRGNEAWQALGK